MRNEETPFFSEVLAWQCFAAFAEENRILRILEVFWWLSVLSNLDLFSMSPFTLVFCKYRQSLIWEL